MMDDTINQVPPVTADAQSDSYMSSPNFSLVKYHKNNMKAGNYLL